MTTRMRRLALPAIVLLVAVMLAALALVGGGGGTKTVDTRGVGPDVGTEPSSSPSPEQKPSAAMMAPLRYDGDYESLTIGEPDAPLVMVEFGSYGCLWCGNFHRLTMPVVMEKYVDTGLLRIEERIFPYEEGAEPGAKAALAAAEQGKFWALSEHIYPYVAGDQVPTGGELSDADKDAYFQRRSEDSLLSKIGEVAPEIGLDMDRFLGAYRSAKTAQKMEEDTRLAYSLGFTGTPGFVVNGVPQGGFVPPETFTQFLDAVLEASTT